MDISGDVVSTAQSVFDAITTSTTFSLLIGFLGLYCVVLLANIVFLFVLRPVSGDLKKGFFGTKERPLVSAGNLLREWKRIEARLASNILSERKVAILEADAFVDRVLSELGYPGKDAGERFHAISPSHFSGLGGLLEAHDIRNRIVQEKDFPFESSEAVRILNLYRSILDEAEIFS